MPREGIDKMNGFKKVIGVKTIWAVLLLALFAQGEELYNGIRMEGAWPPVRALSRAYRPVPYLENRPDVVLIDVGRQLFVDDFLIESTTLKRRFHQPRMHPENPVIQPGVEGQEKYAIAFSDGIFYDPRMKRFRAWYRCDADTCYATSTDGVQWERPELDVVPGTNIVRKGMRDSTSVWLDLNEKDPAKRHKMMVFTSGRLDDAIHFVASPDGIHWGEALGTGRTYKQPNYDRSSMFFNPFRNRWIYSVRVSNVGPLSAPELPPGIGRVRYYKEVGNFAEGWKERQELAQWESADERDLPDPVIKVPPQLYNLDATPYESLMLGLFSIWRGPENAEVKDRPKRNEIVLGYSRDGFHWDRPDRRPFIGVSDKRGDWNWGNVQSVGGGCVVVGDNLYFYFSGRRGNPSGTTGGNADGDAGTGLAVLRRDGFASMDAAGEGVLLTRKLRFSGAHLFVNADAKRGSITAEVLDANGNVLEPFSRKNSIAVKQDGIRLALKWKGGRSLAELAGKDVSIRFHVRDASLYAFWVSPTPAGESRGFLAAGSVGDAAVQDLP